MKKLQVLLLWLALLLPIWAQESLPTPTVESTPVMEQVEEHPAHEDLRLLKQHLEDAFNARDIKSLMEGVSDKIVFTTIEGDVLVGRDNLEAYLEKMVAGPNPRIKEASTKITVEELTFLYSGDGRLAEPSFGVAYGHSDDRYLLEDDSSVELSPRWTAALVRDDMSWKLASFQYTVDLYENPVLERAKGLLSLALLGVGLLGCFLGYFAGRRKAGSSE